MFEFIWNVFEFYALAGNLDRYAEIGMEYVEKLRAIIRVNDLDKYATAKLQ